MLSSLDREKKDHYILTALAKDNPGDVASNRRENSVQVRDLGVDTKDVVVEAAGKAFTGWVLQGRSRAALAPESCGGGREKQEHRWGSQWLWLRETGALQEKLPCQSPTKAAKHTCK